jgi:hypothetical protein
MQQHFTKYYQTVHENHAKSHENTMNTEDSYTVDIVVRRCRWIGAVEYKRTTIWSVAVQPGRIYDITIKSLERPVELTLVMPPAPRRRS